MDYEVEMPPKCIMINYKLPTGKLPAYPQEEEKSGVYEYCATMYCPSCGSQGIWIGGPDDYYVGKDHVCVKCSAVFNMPCGPSNGRPQVIAELIKETP